jgi:hypothetical protein
VFRHYTVRIQNITRRPIQLFRLLEDI